MWISEIIFHAIIYFIIPVIIVLSGAFTFKLYKHIKKGKKLILLSYIPMLFFTACIYALMLAGMFSFCQNIRYICFGFTVLHFIVYSFIIYYLFRNNFIYSPLKTSIMLVLLFIFQSFICSVSASLIYFSYFQ